MAKTNDRCRVRTTYASPLPQVMPKNENDLIIPARQGNINIL